MLNGDLAGAWSLNAWTTCLGIVLGVCVLAWIVEAMGGPRLRLPLWVGPVTQNRVYRWLGVTGLIFMVVRNLV